MYSEGARFSSLSGHRLPPPLVGIFAFFFSPFRHKSSPSQSFSIHHSSTVEHKAVATPEGTVTVNSRAVTLLGRSDLGLSPQKPWFSPRSVHLRFVGDEVALRQVLLLVLRVYPVTSNIYSTSSWVTQSPFSYTVYMNGIPRRKKIDSFGVLKGHGSSGSCVLRCDVMYLVR